MFLLDLESVSFQKANLRASFNKWPLVTQSGFLSDVYSSEACHPWSFNLCFAVLPSCPHYEVLLICINISQGHRGKHITTRHWLNSIILQYFDKWQKQDCSRANARDRTISGRDDPMLQYLHVTKTQLRNMTASCREMRTLSVLILISNGVNVKLL